MERRKEEVKYSVEHELDDTIYTDAMFQPREEGAGPERARGALCYRAGRTTGKDVSTG